MFSSEKIIVALDTISYWLPVAAHTTVPVSYVAAFLWLGAAGGLLGYVTR